MKEKPYLQQIEEYQEKYGKIPIDREDILKYLEKELRLTDKDFAKIAADDAHVQSIPWETLQIILPIIPKPTPRARLSGRTHRFYVTGAAENKKILKYYIEDVYNIIYTQTYFHVTTYLPTPLSSMTKCEVYRAEKGTLAPTVNPDWDNLGKTYSDMVQHILILNDNIITRGQTTKFYSVKPRVEIVFHYQRGFDSRFNKHRIEHSTSYKEAIETGGIIEVYTEGDDYW